MVSPVASAAAITAVPSISPTTISALRPGRRRTLRTPSRKNTRFRSASSETAARAAASAATNATSSAPMGMPKSFVISAAPLAARLAGRDGGGVRDDDVVHLPPRRRPVEGHELRDLFRVEAAAAAKPRVGRLVALPERDRERLALLGEQHVHAAVAVLLPQRLDHRVAEE